MGGLCFFSSSSTLLLIHSTVMGLDITDERIGVAIARHPSPNNRVAAIEPIPYVTNNKRAYYNTRRHDDNERVAAALEQLVKKHKISGFVVGWPLQPDGRPGGPCGKVLHLLDISPKIPVPPSSTSISPSLSGI